MEIRERLPIKIDLKHKKEMRKELLNFRQENLLLRAQRLKVLDIIEKAKSKNRNLRKYLIEIEDVLIEKGEEQP